MVFVVTDREHGRRKELTTLLISAFPGSTVYQHTSLAHASCDLIHHRVDALLAADEPDSREELVQAGADEIAADFAALREILLRK